MRIRKLIFVPSFNVFKHKQAPLLIRLNLGQVYIDNDVYLKNAAYHDLNGQHQMQK